VNVRARSAVALAAGYHGVRFVVEMAMPTVRLHREARFSNPATIAAKRVN
jgi:hypothetical protein